MKNLCDAHRCIRGDAHALSKACVSGDVEVTASEDVEGAQVQLLHCQFVSLVIDAEKNIAKCIAHLAINFRGGGGGKGLHKVIKKCISAWLVDDGRVWPRSIHHQEVPLNSNSRGDHMLAGQERCVWLVVWKSEQCNCPIQNLNRKAKLEHA